MIVDHIEIAKLELEDGDILLVRVPPNWTHEQQANVSRGVQAAVDIARKRATVLTGTTDIEFQVVRKLDK